VPFALIYFIDSPENTFVTDILLVVLLFFQLTFKPFTGKWRNALDSYFLLNLIVLFSGSLYFSSRAEFNCGDMRQQVLENRIIFSTVFINLGFLGFIIVLVYHIFNCFTKLKDTFLKFNCCRKKSEMVNTEVPQKMETHEEPLAEHPLVEDFSSVEYSTVENSHSTSQMKKPHPVVTFSEFRDSILELEGSIEITSVPHTKLTGARNVTV